MIFYFSATGNCKYVSERLASATADTAVSMLSANLKIPACLTDETVGVVIPTYAWGLPTVVSDFLKTVKFETQKKPYLYFIATYGTTPGNTGYIADRLLQHNNGWSFDAFFSVKMPDTWTPMFDLSDKSKVDEINAGAETLIDGVIERVKRRDSGNFMKNRVPVFTSVFAAPYYNAMRKTKHFRVEETCVDCGLCEKKCPVGAIQMQNGKPAWIKEQCVMCLGCLHHCPKFAIQYGRHTKEHGQYTNPHVKL